MVVAWGIFQLRDLARVFRIWLYALRWFGAWALISFQVSALLYQG